MPWREPKFKGLTKVVTDITDLAKLFVEDHKKKLENLNKVLESSETLEQMRKDREKRRNEKARLANNQKSSE